MKALCGALASPITDEDRARDFHQSQLFGAASSSPQTVRLTDKHDWYVQGSESCVPTSHVSSVNDLARIRGAPFARKPGAGRLFATTQMRQGLIIPGKGLANSGSSCGFALAEMRDPDASGIIADDDYPDNDENATRVPPLSAFEADVLFRITGAHRILFEEAPDPVTTLRTGILAAMNLAAQGKAAMPTACMTVDDAYGNLPVGAVYSATGGNVWGGHCQQITEVDEDLDAIGFATSWGGERVFYVSIPWFAKNGAAAFVIEDYTT